MITEETFYSLTYPQKSIWYLEKLNPCIGIGNIVATLKINEPLDLKIMNRALNLMLKRNDGFRLQFHNANNEVSQYLTPFKEYKADYFDFSKSEIEKLYSWEREQTLIPFDLQDKKLYYFAFIKTSDDSYNFFARVNHLISDAWSLVMIGNEIMYYSHLIRNDKPIPTDNNPSYLEFLKKEEAYLTSVKYEKDRTFWRNKYNDIPELTTVNNKSSSRISLNSKRKSFVLPKKLAKKIQSHGSETKTSVFAMFFSAMCMYINRIKDINDITIGTPVLNRTNIKEKKTMGMFVITVPIRINIKGDQNFVQLSKAIESEWFSVLKHRKYPFDRLTKDIRENNKEFEKLYDIAISYQNAKIKDSGDGYSYEARWHSNESQVESLYLHINDREDKGNLILNYDYLADAFYEKEIEYMHEYIISLLWHALDDPYKKLKKLNMLPEIERKKLLVSLNNTNADYDRHITLSQIFENQVNKNPDSIALVFKDKCMTYHELNIQSNILAHHLRRKGVGPESIVPIILPRSFEMIIAILGIVKSGGAYLPIDPEYPAERVSYMLENSRSSLLLSTPTIASSIDHKCELIDIYDVHQRAHTEEETKNLENLNTQNDLLYIIYTSGSTGRPKGVMIEHRNVVRLLFNSKFQFDFNDTDCWTLFHSYCFDFSVWEMYGALLYGGKLVIVPEQTTKDTPVFLDLLKEEKVTILNQTPAAFYNLVDIESKKPNAELSVRTVIFGGDALKPLLLKPFREKYHNTKLINMYGITETTVHVTFKELTNDDIKKNISNIGKPIPTTKTYILDKNMTPLPIGVPGELFVGGEGVGRGYLNNETLTNEKFFENPFVPNEMIYRSGDLARFFAKGDIEYLGRIDTQVKIRGHRIELGEIESQILKFIGISAAVVLLQKTSSGNSSLVSYYVPKEDVDVRALRTFLQNYLPDYMIPSCFVCLDKILLNSNGKIDVKKLPLPSESDYIHDEYIAPQNEFQSLIAKVWSEVLDLKKIGINDNFFQLGGDSMSAVTVVSMLGENFKYPDLYNNPTIKSLSDAIIKKKYETSSKELLMKIDNNLLEAKSNIICFPYGGGSGVIYMELAASILKVSDDYNIFTINLPGHDLNGNPNDLVSNHTIAKDLVYEIKNRVKGDIVFYGHCVGSALAIETAKLLQNEGIDIKKIFLGGILPPSNFSFPWIKQDPWRLVPDRSIIKFLKSVGLPELTLTKENIKIMVSSFRHDVRNYYSFFRCYNEKYDQKLTTPTSCIIGDKDPITLNYKRRYKNWTKYLIIDELHVLKNASHYFIKSNSKEVANILVSQSD